MFFSLNLKKTAKITNSKFQPNRLKFLIVIPKRKNVEICNFQLKMLYKVPHK